MSNGKRYDVVNAEQHGGALRHFVCFECYQVIGLEQQMLARSHQTSGKCWILNSEQGIDEAAIDKHKRPSNCVWKKVNWLEEITNDAVNDANGKNNEQQNWIRCDWSASTAKNAQQRLFVDTLDRRNCCLIEDKHFIVFHLINPMCDRSTKRRTKKKKKKKT